MSEENEISEREDDLTIPQYQRQIENLDYELQKLKGKFYIIENEHKRVSVKLNRQLKNAQKALEKPMADLQKKEKEGNEMKYGNVEEKNKKIAELNELKKEPMEAIDNKEKLKDEKLREESELYEKSLMLENDTKSSEIEIEKFNKEIPELEKVTEDIVKTYPNEFKKLTDDFKLYDSKNRIETNIKTIEDKISYENYKVEEFKELKKLFKAEAEKRQAAYQEIEVKIKVNQEKQDDISKLEKEINETIPSILLFQKFPPMFDAYYNIKYKLKDLKKVTLESIKEIVNPFLEEINDEYQQQYDENKSKIDELQVEIDNLNDYTPLTQKIKAQIKEAKEDQAKFQINVDFASKLLGHAKTLIDFIMNYKESEDDKNDYKYTDLEKQMILSLGNLINEACMDDKELIKDKYDEYLLKLEEKTSDYYTFEEEAKKAKELENDIKSQEKAIEEFIVMHSKLNDDLEKDLKKNKTELKSIIDTINLREKELKENIKKFTEKEFSKYFNSNKDLLKHVLCKQKKVVIINNEYELTKDQIIENVLIDHGRKKTTVDNALKRKYLIEYLSNLYKEDINDDKPMSERMSKKLEEKLKEIQDLCNEIEELNKKIKEIDDQILELKGLANKDKKASIVDRSMQKLQNEISKLQNNLAEIENQVNAELEEYNHQKKEYEEQSSQLLEGIRDLEGKMNLNLNSMTEGVINAYLKVNNNLKGFEPHKNKFNPSTYGYGIREFYFSSEENILYIKDVRNNLVIKKIKYELIKKIELDPISQRFVNDLENKMYNDEIERDNDPLRKDKIKFFIILRSGNVDVVARNYDEYKKFADMINTIVLHK